VSTQFLFLEFVPFVHASISYDYVDNNTSNVDSVSDLGTQSNFTAEQDQLATYDTYTEELVTGSTTTLINAQSFEGTWLPTGWSEDPGDSAWNKDSSQHYAGSYSAGYEYAVGMTAGKLVTPQMNMTGASSISLSFYFYDNNLDKLSDMLLDLYDGANWDVYSDIGIGVTEEQWVLWNYTITDSQYFVSTFRVRWRGGVLTSGENAYLDYVTCKKVIADTYRLDQEIQWTSVPADDYPTVILCIKTGTLDAENLGVSIWYQSAWTSLASDLTTASGWNNYSIKQYCSLLYAVNVTIRFLDGTLLADAIQSSWQIDASLITLYPPPPEYDINTVGNINDTASGQCQLHAYWTANDGSMDSFVVEHNNTGTNINYTYEFTGAKRWSNYTFTLNAIGDCLIKWRIHANDTNGLWNQTDWQYFYCWKQLPAILEKKLGVSTGGSRSQGSIYFNGTATGGKCAIYTCFANSTFSPWKYQVKAYDLAAKTWTDTYNIADASGDDIHYNPSISVLPDGRLICLYAYASFLTYRISSYNASTTSNLAMLISNWDSEQSDAPSGFCYPEPIRWNDKLLVFGRLGSTDGGDWQMRTWTGTGFNETTLIYFNTSDSHASLYAHASKVGDSILLGFNKYDYTNSELTGLYMVYSPDKGTTWKYWNGTTASLPINGDLCLVSDSDDRTFAMSPVLDENGKPIIAGIKQHAGTEDAYTVLATYSKLLGESGGTWTYGNITYSNGTQITGNIFIQYLDYYYNRPSGWGSIENCEGKIGKVVREYNETHKFRVIWVDNDETAVVLNANPMYSCVNIQDAPEAYDALTNEEYFALGNDEICSTRSTLSQNYIEGVKFTATKTTVALGIRVYYNCTSIGYEEFQGALYDSSLHLLVAGPKVGHSFGVNINTQRWCYPSTFQYTLTQGTTYWIIFRHSCTGSIKGFREEGSTNQNLFLSYDYDTDLPSTLTPDGYDEYTYTVKAVTSKLIVRGLGNLPDFEHPSYSNVGTNTTIAGESCNFYTYWNDDVGLSGYIYGTNNTGTWQNASWTAFTTTPDWSNVTKTLNNTEGVSIEWCIWANDTSDKWNDTGIQSFITPMNLEYAITNVVSIEAIITFMKETLFSLPSITEATGLTSFLKEVQPILIEILGASSILVNGLEARFGSIELLVSTVMANWGKETWVSITETTELSHQLTLFREMLFNLLSTATSTSAISLKKEIYALQFEYMVTQILNTTSNLVWGKETLFTASAITALTSQLQTLREMVFDLLTTATSTSTITFGKETIMVEFEQAITQTVNTLSQLHFFKEIAYSLAELTQVLANLAWGKEAWFSNTASAALTSTLQLFKEMVQGFSAVTSTSIINTFGLESIFTVSESTTFIHSLTLFREMLFDLFSMANSISTLNFEKEVIMVNFEQVISQTVNPQATLNFFKETAFAFSQTLEALANLAWGKEAWFSNTASVALTSTLQLFKEAIFNLPHSTVLNAVSTFTKEYAIVLFEILETITAQAVLDYAFETIIEEAVDIAFVLAAFAVVMTLALWGVEISKKRKGENA